MLLRLQLVMSYCGLARRECGDEGAALVKPCSADNRAVGWSSFIHTTAPAGDEAGDQGPSEVNADTWSKESGMPELGAHAPTPSQPGAFSLAP